MGRHILAVLILIFTALGAIYFWIGVPEVYSEKFPEDPKPHFYRSPGQSIGDIKIAAFYFLPKDKSERFAENWGEILDNNLSKLKKFHSAQLRGFSKLDYEIYPGMVIGEKESLLYDTEVTQHGNPQALRNIAPELERRVFDVNGDLFTDDFLPECRMSGERLVGRGGIYCVIVIIYEGIGASGSENVALLSRIFLTDSQYSARAATLLAHEFYHTIGLPDTYDITTSVPFSSDIMGLGRFKPIEKTYLDKDHLIQLGL